jgi:hypothetical protein
MLLGIVLVAGTASTLFAAGNSSRSADRERATSAALSIADLPVGWHQYPHAASHGLDAIAASIPECRSFKKVAETLRDAHESSGFRDFAQRPESFVSNSVAVFTSAKTASAALTLFGQERTGRCLQRALTRELRQLLSKASPGATLKSLDMARTAVNPTGDRTVAYEATISIQVGTLAQSFKGDIQISQVGRSAAYFYFYEIMPSLRSSLVTTVLNRLHGKTTASLA